MKFTGLNCESIASTMDWIIEREGQWREVGMTRFAISGR